MITFLIGFIGSIFVYNSGSVTHKIFGTFLGFVSFMQLIEYLLWKHQTCDNYNRFLSITAMIINHLQPVVLGMAILFFNKKMTSSTISYILGIMIIYLCVIIPYSMQFLRNKTLLCTIKNNKTQHLLWNWNHLPNSSIVYTYFFTLGMALLFLIGIPEKKMAIFSAFVCVFTYISSYFLYPKYFAGSLWCFYTAFIPAFYYMTIKLSRMYKGIS
jgi:hypothetical protein